MQEEKDWLFYAANFDPEVNRLYKSFLAQDQKRIEMFKKVTLQTVDNLLLDKNLTNNGKSEWLEIRDMVEVFENLDVFSQNLLCKYGVPFSFQFARQFNL